MPVLQPAIHPGVESDMRPYREFHHDRTDTELVHRSEGDGGGDSTRAHLTDDTNYIDAVEENVMGTEDNDDDEDDEKGTSHDNHAACDRDTTAIDRTMPSLTTQTTQYPHVVDAAMGLKTDASSLEASHGLLGAPSPSVLGEIIQPQVDTVTLLSELSSLASTYRRQAEMLQDQVRAALVSHRFRHFHEIALHIYAE